MLAVGDAGGILKVRHRIHELGRLQGDHGLQSGEVDAIFRDRDRQKPRPVDRKGLDGPQVAGLLDDNPLPLVQQGLTDKVEPLLSPVGDQDILGIDDKVLLFLISPGDILPQPEVPLGVAVLKDIVAVDLEDLGCCPLDFFGRKKIPVGETAGKGDHRPVQGDL